VPAAHLSPADSAGVDGEEEEDEEDEEEGGNGEEVRGVYV